MRACTAIDVHEAETLQVLLEARRFVVEAVICTELFLDVAALVRTTGDTDDLLAPGQLGQLDRNRPDGTGGSRDDDHLVLGGQLSDVEQAPVSGLSDHAQNGKGLLRSFESRGNLLQGRDGGDSVFLPSDVGRDVVADGEAFGVGTEGDDGADSAGAHD
ncbi:BQ5605_C013g07371 [Microbotryum silenes-dioicae]|uniref:BQ5605_C013g07371 protein n=1 Tax=Microbotryum silenes-dioicae TaxID=796604 RepID=A0A2X0LVT2_9BASI|nr:BQ5605_C013g07371 [Microbotryum silenes-dioicae]